MVFGRAVRVLNSPSAAHQRYPMDNLIIPFLTHLAGQAPVLLVYLVAMILALVCWRRCPGPCALTLVATGLLLVTTLVQSFLFPYLSRARIELGWSNEQYGWVLSANALVGSMIRAAAFSLLLTAVFIGRKDVPQAGSAEALRPTGPAKK
jgi:hypothetical protein